jgi:chromosome segregation ATPase
MPPTDSRIQSLTAELTRLRNSREQADNQLHGLLLKLTEIQLNLATQDRTLLKLDQTLNGNSNNNVGLVTRVDRVEHLARGLVKATWLLVAALVTASLKWISK